MKKILTFLLVWSMALSVHAFATGDWKHYLSYTNALSSAMVGDEIFANFGGNLLSYHPVDGEVRTYSKLNGLNGQNISSMAYSETEKCLVLVYSDLLVDLYFPEEDVIVAVPQFRNTGMDGMRLNNLFIDGENAILAFNYGVAHLNLKHQSVTGFYTFEEEVITAAYHQKVLYAATADRLLACSTEGNPLDKNEWKTIQKAAFSEFISCGEFLCGVTAKEVAGGMTAGVWRLNADGESFERLSSVAYPHVAALKSQLVLADDSRVLMYDLSNPDGTEKALRCKNHWNSLDLGNDGLFWASDGFSGLQAYQVSGDSLKMKGEPVGNLGPRRDLCYFMKFFGNRLMIAGGRLDPMDRLHYPGTIMELTDGKWKTFQDEGISEQTGVPYRDITCLVIDPKDENHIIASAGGTGLYEFENYKFKKHISNHNSPLVSAAGKSPKYVRMDGLIYDADDNLWMVNNSMEDTILRVRRPDGTWNGIFIEGLTHAPTCEKTLIDRKGRLWVASRRTVEEHLGGLLCLDYNGTVGNVKDDVATYRSEFINQDGKSYNIEGVFCMTEDKNGAIWVGTRTGLFVINDPDNWASSNFRVIQVKVPRNDGTNLADYLLADMMITAIATDGADRKWIGAEGSGLYLVSPDGTKILAHFDEANSYLLSNNIYSIAPNLETGEIMIGTDKGLCSYMSSASLPETSLDKNKIKVYPNPVRPEYNGNLTVTGLTDNAEVKVMTTSGEVVAMGTSTGGSFVWNVRGGDGARVAAGVYYLMIATADGKEGIAAKFVVI